MATIIINRIIANKSLVDGPGIRTLLFLQGCDIHCPECQNASSWDITEGTPIDIDELIDVLMKTTINKKITITGGEPLLQKESLEYLVHGLADKGFDIALYTGHDKADVPQAILDGLTYLKYGPYQRDKRTTITPYVGSTNQVFERIKH